MAVFCHKVLYGTENKAFATGYFCNLIMDQKITDAYRFMMQTPGPTKLLKDI